MRLREVIKQLTPPLVVEVAKRLLKGDAAKADLRRYNRAGNIPWSQGYDIYKRNFIIQTLGSDDLLLPFRRGTSLPSGYGVGIDERCIEYPWLVAHTHDGQENYLDAGSTLNYDFILDHPTFRRKTMHILTLAPEANCYWQRGISYIFSDLRDMPYRDAYFDTIACLSTLEHVGCDNTSYTSKGAYGAQRPKDFVFAMQEFARVLKSGGELFVTVPFGVYSHFGTFQQFDRELLSQAIEAFGKATEVTETFYQYTVEGWKKASAADCTEC